MELEGQVWKDGKGWIVEVPCLNVTTEGRTKKDAFLMIQDAVFELMVSYFDDLDKEFKVTVYDRKEGTFGLTSNDDKRLVSFLRIRQKKGKR